MITPPMPTHASTLLEWYDRHARELPWRVGPGSGRVRQDPYLVWLSEIMLQQTTVEAVKPYFVRFTNRWPDIAALAAADDDDIMKEWAGLGYYSRARNLLRCAREIVSVHEGKFPADVAELRKLPGIGDYTAAAIAAIAFDIAAPVMDGNVERVVARLFAIGEPLPGAKRAIRERLSEITPPERPGDFAQAMMDLGATTCTPKRPSCFLCPFKGNCVALASGDPERLPVKAPKAEKPMRRGAAFVAERADGAVLLRKRPPQGLLGGMSEVPMSDWSARRDGETGKAAAPFAAEWRKAGRVRHVFTHFALELDVFHAGVTQATLEGGWWSPRRELDSEALPTLVRKVIATALEGT